MQANDVREYPKTTTLVTAVAHREVDTGLVDHYYLQRFPEEERKGFEARNCFLDGGDSGAIALAAGAGILKTTDNPEGAERSTEYLLSETALAYFSTTTKEYPPVDGGSVDPGLGDLTDAQGTLFLLREMGMIPYPSPLPLSP